MLPELSAQLPAIIGEAAKSPLGIFALMIISLAILGFFFFKEATEKTRIAIFVMLFVGVAVFGLSIVRTTSAGGPASAAPPAAEDPLVKSILGTWTADVIYYPPRSFQETFTFEISAGKLEVTSTFLRSPRKGLNVQTGNGVVQFDIQRQEVDGEVTTDIVSSYVGQVHSDRIDFALRLDNSEPVVRFQARRAESPRN